MANTLPHWQLLIAVLSLVSLPAWAVDNYKEYRRDRWDFEFNTQYFYSEANYPSSGGGSQNLPSGNHYSLWDMDLESRYMPRSDWSVLAWGKMSNSESKDSLATRSNSSITEVAAGMDFLMYDGSFQLVPEFIAVVPLEEVDPKSDSVLNSEGVFELLSRLIAQKDFGTYRGYAWVGFNYRGDGRSFLLPYGIGAQLKLPRMRLGAELFGYRSITDDTEDTILRTGYINSANAGSMKFYSVNPNILDSQVYGNWLISPKWTVQVNGGATLAGSNAAAGFHVGGFLRYSFDMTEGYSEEPAYEPVNSPVPNYRSQMHESELSSEKQVPTFREQTDDGIDQNLFKPRPTKKPRKKPVDTQLQQQLDDAEFQIELKADKKKKRNR
ncbi:hypothetical protein [Bdellovibrio sp. ArHS]|uniref:hypothetical protein n=1 Tax=Bdellovibrio sp. ArHS TaxID=1569284 RepID=UPI0025B87F1D|nr:hypothetical protein [Bdellovibrio sp. ArHS]